MNLTLARLHSTTELLPHKSITNSCKKIKPYLFMDKFLLYLSFFYFWKAHYEELNFHYIYIKESWESNMFFCFLNSTFLARLNPLAPTFSMGYPESDLLINSLCYLYCKPTKVFFLAKLNLALQNIARTKMAATVYCSAQTHKLSKTVNRGMTWPSKRKSLRS